MLSINFLVTLSLACLSHASVLTVTPSAQNGTQNYQDTCSRIASAVSNSSQVFYPNSTQYVSDNAHALVSSSQESACSVEPGTAADVGVILVILGSTRTPFAVKGGGHAYNPGFSSTNGVQISMNRFNTLELNNATGTLDAGSGIILDQAYTFLNSTGFNIIAGRVPGVGISGLTLGGGYSFMSNQYGLTIDNMAAFELVLPNGTVTNVTESNEDLWFALRGGGNNFGIVTKFTYKTIPQGQIWGGTLNFTADQQDLMKDALVNFQQTNDPNASLSLGAVYTPVGVEFITILFYNAPTPAPGIFDDFLAISTNQSDVNTRSFLDFFSTFNFINSPTTARGYVNGISVTQYSPSVFDAAMNQTLASVALLLEPFLTNLFSHGNDSACPPDRSHALFPTGVTISFSNASLDDTVVQAMNSYSDAITAAAVADGQNLTNAAVYPNYALFDTPLEDIYGANIPRLQAIQIAVDPDNVMGLTGGFKL
ncbi:FAD-binding domain-containing protein [Lactarius quietus]|nr:FAD-binding domain-containing protein [Lactarius quietus]